MPWRDLLGLGGLPRGGECSWGEDRACAPSHPLQEVGQSRRGSEVSLDNPLPHPRGLVQAGKFCPFSLSGRGHLPSPLRKQTGEGFPLGPKPTAQTAEGCQVPTENPQMEKHVLLGSHQGDQPAGSSDPTGTLPARLTRDPPCPRRARLPHPSSNLGHDLTSVLQPGSGLPTTSPLSI